MQLLRLAEPVSIFPDRDAPAPPGAARPGSITRAAPIRRWPPAVAVGGVALILFLLRDALLPFAVAGALAFLVTPAIDRAHRRVGGPRWILAIIAYLAILAIFGAIVAAIAGHALREAGELGARLPRLVHRALEELLRLLGPAIGALDLKAIAADIDQRLAQLPGPATALAAARYGLDGLFAGILALVVLAYFLIAGRRIANGLLWLVPPAQRPQAAAVAATIQPLLWRYLAGLAVVVAATSTTAWMVFGPIFHLPHAALLAVAVGLLELIPVVGPAVALALIGLAAIEQASVAEMAALCGFAIALRIAIDELLGPVVLGRAVRLHPVAILFAFVAGGTLFGMVGLLLAVPAAAVLKIVLAACYAEPAVVRVPQ